MAKKAKKQKKVSAKKLKYEKFHKEKPSVLDISMPDLSQEEQTHKQVDEGAINMFLRNRVRVPEKHISERKAKSKR